MSGGKGGGQTARTEIPAWLEGPARQNLARAQQVQQLGYMPYYGPDVAAFSPMQQQAMQSTMDTAAAFGMAPQGTNAMAGMPAPQEFAGGVQGYSSGGLFDQAVAELAARRPGQTAAYDRLFLNPNASPTGVFGGDLLGQVPPHIQELMRGRGGGAVRWPSVADFHVR